MPTLTTPIIGGATGSAVRTLHGELRTLGFEVRSNEARSDRFGDTTKKAVVDFQQKFGIEPTGAVDPATGALLVATAKFSTDGNTDELRDSLTEAVTDIPDSPVLAHWLARYQILAGNYDKARVALDILNNIPGAEGFSEPLTGILEGPSNVNLQPEVQHPGNFYTYQYSIFDLETVERFRWMLLDFSDAPAAATDTIPGTLFLKRDDGQPGSASSSDQPHHPDRMAPEPPTLRPLDGNTGEQVEQNAGSAGFQALSAFRHWHLGNQDMSRGLFSRAHKHYSACRNAAVRYFLYQYRGTDDGQHPATIRATSNHKAQLIYLLTDLRNTKSSREAFWTYFDNRNTALSLDELHRLTWIVPFEVLNSSQINRAELLNIFSLENNLPDNQLQKTIEVPLATLIYVLLPLAQAEALRQRGDFDNALSAVNNVALPLRIEIEGPVNPVNVGGNNALFAFSTFRTPIFSVQAPFTLANPHIEKPAALLLKAQILLAKADREYKARRLVNAKENYQQLIDLFNENEAYKLGIEAAVTTLQQDVAVSLGHNFHPLAIGDVASPAITKEQRREFELLGKKVSIPATEAETETLPGLDNRVAPHQPMLKFLATDGTTNPLIFSLIAEARSRLLQIENGFNYLGYSDDYIPPWRFQFLLGRARYFTDHAKNAQREYLNFLGNAEREELQEITASQTVELEKSNVRIETARVEQARLETEVAKLGKELAILVSENSNTRFNDYKKFDEYADDLLNNSDARLISSFLKPLSKVPLLHSAATAVGDFYSGGSVSGIHRKAVEGVQRELEKKNLGLAVPEAQKSADIAGAQLQTAQAALVISGLQRTASLLRHEFAIQSLNFLTNRTLNSETWYRLANMIRSVAETYMRYAIELSFLAEQAYEFEADKRINVIRFDYDISEEGKLLAADFLKQDLDTLEQDLIVTQRQRQQQVKYVLSLSREFPEALEALRENDSTIFTLRLEQLERRFPGLYNIRIGSLDVLPIALMDPLQFSLQVSYLGSSQVRLKAHPDTLEGENSPTLLNNTDEVDIDGGWLSDFSDQWPVKVQITGPETTVYSGLSQAEAQSVFPFISSGQRGAFESLGAAASWHIDMGMAENKVVPGSLADVLITFNVSGYFDPQLRRAVDVASQTDDVLTSWISARQSFPDEFYEFNQSGKLSWNVTREILSFDRSLGALRNMGLRFIPVPSNIHFSQIQSRYVVQFEVDPQGDIDILSEIPRITYLSDQLTLNTQVELEPGAEFLWDFGDGTELQQGAAQSHIYQQPGMYEVKLRVNRNNRLSEFNSRIAISELHSVVAPNTAFPQFSAQPGPDNQIRVDATTEGTNGLANTSFWKLGQENVVRGSSAAFDLKPGTYVMAFTAIRDLKAHIYSHQQFGTQQSFTLNGLRITSNREFELDGSETTVAPNELTGHFFSGVPLSPVDEWTVEVRLEDNSFLKGIGQNDIEKFEAGEIADAALILEYEVPAS